MSEPTFRAVVASVLVAVLALAVLVVTLLVVLPREPAAVPSVSAPASPLAQGPTAVPTPMSPAPHVFGTVGVVGVGDVPRGGTSGHTLVLRFLEPSRDAIPDAAGSFFVTLTDHAGVGSTVAFTGTGSITAPGSLGATLGRVTNNELVIGIRASDPYNVELIIISGFGISASPTAALGPVRAVVGGFAGSLAGGVANDVLPSLGTVVAGP